MNDTLERDTLIDQLDRLGSDQDEDVLAAARAIHSAVSGAGMRWDDLLVADEPATRDEPDADRAKDDSQMEGDGDFAEADAPQSAMKLDVNESETRALIDKLLAREGNSNDFREELEEYKSDLANGDFESSDHRYVHALYARLTKSR